MIVNVKTGVNGMELLVLTILFVISSIVTVTVTQLRNENHLKRLVICSEDKKKYSKQ
jgi:hypothetical protein